MARNHITEVKLACVDAWSTLMGTDTDGDPVLVDYAWPGQFQRKAGHVWLYGGTADYADRAVKSGRRWRTVLCSFTVVAEVYRVAPQVDDTGAVSLQQQCDEALDEITGAIEEWIADNPRLGFDPDSGKNIVIDWAVPTSERLEHGPTENGCVSGRILEITYQARIR